MNKYSTGLLTAVLAGTFNLAQADTIKMECAGFTGINKDYCAYIKQRFESETPHKVNFIELPQASNEKLGIFQQVFAAKDGDAVDLFQADTVWIGLLDKHLMDLTEHVKDMEADFFASAWQNNVVDGRVKAVPAFLDSGMLYYRKDLLVKYDEQPPETWEDLTRIANKIQLAERNTGKEGFWGMVFQGKAYEGLTCDALEWISSYNGGSIVEPNGDISINNPQAAKALNMAANWVGTISPKGVMGYMEEESRAVFQNGDALFMRNWPYAYLLAQGEKSPVKGKVGVMPIPKGGADGKHAATLGGWQWAISDYSNNKAAAVLMLKIVTDADSQKKLFFMGGNSPSRIALYDDPDILASAPHLPAFKAVFANAIPRPASATKRQYNRVSNAVLNATYNVLSGVTTGEKAVADLEHRLKRIKGRQWK
ncbi:ABC transporter substrate-binding protein [Psychromonas sp. MB-3u-54]|uniref:ABC transporter substrate-binding protein n=1 Tax=Psychromonas sp. MB-3u-54 TaxID=2058319 RepID=UPI000C348E6C|nr:ABC transporter substrate-binding protein [Psychromonas sp. MB-3u-54]PKH04264.1 ABC transporter substrate-binding protein [Psychromonas sp. MB-3u-54]